MGCSSCTVLGRLWGGYNHILDGVLIVSLRGDATHNGSRSWRVLGALDRRYLWNSRSPWSSESCNRLKIYTIATSVRRSQRSSTSSVSDVSGCLDRSCSRVAHLRWSTTRLGSVSLQSYSRPIQWQCGQFPISYLCLSTRLSDSKVQWVIARAVPVIFSLSLGTLASAEPFRLL